MTTISTKIPDTLFRQAKKIAEREDMTLDEFIALALAVKPSPNALKKAIGKKPAKFWQKLLTPNRKITINFNLATVTEAAEGVHDLTTHV
jgi:hypothetical protein